MDVERSLLATTFTVYEVTIPNEVHQFDLLYMPGHTLYGNKYKYILSGIDVTSRYKVTRPMKTKQVKDVANMIVDIYKVGPLTYPKVFQYDNESQFKAEVTKIEKTILYSLTPEKHSKVLEKGGVKTLTQ